MAEGAGGGVTVTFTPVESVVPLTLRNTASVAHSRITGCTTETITWA